MKLFLDDWRKCPDRWVLASSYDEMIRLLERHKEEIEEISLDYDLGGMRTGFDVCRWLVQNSYFPPVITIHSDEPVFAPKMYSYLLENVPESVTVRRLL